MAMTQVETELPQMRSDSPDTLLEALMNKQDDDETADSEEDDDEEDEEEVHPDQMNLIELILNCEWRHCMLRIESSPKETKVKQLIMLDQVQTRAYPLHLAVTMKPPKHIIEALINANPDAIKSREEKWGRLPLHLACIFTASAQVLRVLMDSYNESLRITDKSEGRLPLHYASLYGSPFEISLLVNAEQRALVFKDGSGKSPLDLAHESKNPHKEAILKRLGDRTRLVTEAMMERRKRQNQQTTVKPALTSTTASAVPVSENTNKKEATKTTSLRTNGVENDDGAAQPSNGHGEHTTKRLLEKSYSTSHIMNQTKQQNQDDIQDLMKFKNRVSSRSRDRNSNKSNDGGINMNNLIESETPSSNASSTGSSKKKKPKKKKDSGKSWGTNHFQANNHSEKEPLLALSPYDDDSKEDTPKSDNRSLTEHLESSGPKQKNHLAAFLEANRPTLDSSDDETGSARARALEVRSLPANNFYASSILGNHHIINKQATYHYGENEENELGSVFGSVYGSVMLGSVLEDPEEEFRGNGFSELGVVEERIKGCDIRRQALAQECQYLNDSVARKEKEADRSREVIKMLQNKLLEIQYRIQREKQALSLSETGIQLQKETLALHQMKIVEVDQEVEELLEQHSTLKKEKQATRIANRATMLRQQQKQQSQKMLMDAFSSKMASPPRVMPSASQESELSARSLESEEMNMDIYT